MLEFKYKPWSTVSLSKKDRKGKSPLELDAIRRNRWESGHAMESLRACIVSEVFRQEKKHREFRFHQINADGIVVAVWCDGFVYPVFIRQNLDASTISYKLNMGSLLIEGVVSCADVCLP